MFNSDFYCFLFGVVRECVRFYVERIANRSSNSTQRISCTSFFCSFALAREECETSADREKIITQVHSVNDQLLRFAVACRVPREPIPNGVVLFYRHRNSYKCTIMFDSLAGLDVVRVVVLRVIMYYWTQYALAI